MGFVGTPDQFAGIHLQYVRQASKHGDAHGRLRTFYLAHIPGTETYAIGKIFLSPSARIPKSSHVRRNCLLQIGHSASGRDQHDRSRNDTS
jgi:hypothetical protein